MAVLVAAVQEVVCRDLAAAAAVIMAAAAVMGGMAVHGDLPAVAVPIILVLTQITLQELEKAMGR